jgi:hypothetical protein
MLTLIVSQDSWNAVATAGGYFLFFGVTYRLTSAAAATGAQPAVRLSGEPLLAENDDGAAPDPLPDLSTTSVPSRLVRPKGG